MNNPDILVLGLMFFLGKKRFIFEGGLFATWEKRNSQGGPRLDSPSTLLGPFLG